MATCSVRYIVRDVDAAISFYCDRLGFREVMHPAPAFAMLEREGLRLVLSAPGGGPGGGQAMPDGRLPEPGGWNRFSLEVSDLAGMTSELRTRGVRFRSDIIEGVGGRQVVVEDPSGNPVELFEPTRPEARLAPPSSVKTSSPGHPSHEIDPIGRVESPLRERAEAPRQGYEGAPPAWLIIDPAVGEGVRDLHPGQEFIVLSWLVRASRSVLATRPGDDPEGPEKGVFSKRSPDRPNPVGLHRVTVQEIEGLRIQVSPLEALDGTPIVDIKPVLDRRVER